MTCCVHSVHCCAHVMCCVCVYVCVHACVCLFCFFCLFSTEFAILYDEARIRESHAFDSECSIGLSSNLGNPLYLVLLIIYLLICLAALIQLGRLLILSSVRVFWLMSIEHSLVVAMCITRALNMVRNKNKTGQGNGNGREWGEVVR